VLEASAIASCIKSSFFAAGNLTGLGFCDADGKLVPKVTLNPASRLSGIVYFTFRSVVDPKVTDPSLTLAVMTIEFVLPFCNPLSPLQVKTIYSINLTVLPCHLLLSLLSHTLTHSPPPLLLCWALILAWTP
jgi:hypothetical protein